MHLVLLSSFYFILLLNCSNSLLRLCLFSFVSGIFVIAHWNIFTMAALKELWDNSNICAVLLLASVDCLFPFKLSSSWFLVKRMIFSGIPDVLRPMLGDWILFKSWVLANLTPCHTGGGRATMSYCQVGVEALVPHLASFWHPGVGGSLLLLGGLLTKYLLTEPWLGGAGVSH